MRLIGTAYFKKHLAGFVSNGFRTPDQLYRSFECSDEDREKQWWDTIRSICSDRIVMEEERPPTFTSLWRHWKRARWIASMWRNSISPDPYGSIPAPEESGWTKDDDDYKFDWEEKAVMQSVSQVIEFLTQGCGCKRGCRTLKCGCRKKNDFCGPGCECRGCENVEVSSNGPELEDDPMSDYSDSSSDSSDIETEIVTDFDQ